MDQVKVFLDSDVIISAFLSPKGASFEILTNSKIKKTISQTIKEEVDEVVKRLDIARTQKNIVHGLEVINLKLDKARLVETYLPYVLDPEDSHVAAGAHKAKVRFLLTHNLKHYYLEKIKNGLEIIVMKPGNFLQYLRSN